MLVSAMDLQGPTINAMPHCVLQTIFSSLGPKELCCVTATCTLWYQLNKDAAANMIWKHFYSSRWRPSFVDTSTSWQGLYGKKMLKLQSWAGKYQQDNLYGHKADVKALKLLPSHDMLVSGSNDRTIRLWSLEAGLPIAATSSLNSASRALAVDSHSLVSGHLDHTVRVWEANSVDKCRHLFDLSRAPLVLRGHIGPVSSLSLTEACLYSGSWDYTVRIWSRGDWKCQGVLRYDDWVSCVAARGSHLLVSAGTEVLVHDIATGQVIRKFQNLHEGGVSCLEGAQNGRMLFTGASDGLVLAHDLRMKDPSLVLYHHKFAVNSLAFEDPWLASSSSSGCVMLINTEPGSRLKPASQHPMPAASSVSAVPPTRQLQAPSAQVLAVDLADQWLACSSELGHVRTWSFTGAHEAAMRAASAKASRGSRKGRRLSGPVASAVGAGQPPHRTGSGSGGSMARHSSHSGQGSTAAHSSAGHSSTGHSSTGRHNGMSNSLERADGSVSGRRAGGSHHHSPDSASPGSSSHSHWQSHRSRR